MNTVLILLAALLMVTFAALWSFLAMASWSDRQLALAWREWQKMKPDGDVFEN